MFFISATAGGPAAAPSNVPNTIDPTLVYQADIFLLIVVLVFAVFNAPRAIARFARRSEWSQGHLLRSITLTRQPRINLTTHSIYLHSNPERTVIDLDGGSTENMHPQGGLPAQSITTHNEKVLPPRPFTPTAHPSMQQTWHLPMLSSLVPFLANLLHRRVHDNYSLGQVLLMAGYSIVMFYAGLYQSSPFVDYNRSGWVCVSQLPFIYALATKNNVIGMLIGLGYDKLNYLHRFAGLFAIVAANVHSIGYIYKWSLAGDLSTHLSKPSIIWGCVSLACFDAMGIFSIHFVRSRFYNFFFVTHVVGLIIVLFSVCYHHANCVPYVLVTCVFYGIDHLVRMIKTRITMATLRPIPELGLTRVEIPTINAGWRAGQHVRLRVLSTAMGIWGMTETHPFTIANVSKTEEGLVLLCKKAGRWTTRMYEMANTAVYSDQGRELGRRVRVMVEGPYGGVGNTVISSYSGAIFVVGGSGVTFALSAVQDLVRSGHSSDVTDIDIVWTIADPGSLTPMIPFFSALISQSTAARLRVSVFYTRAPARSLDGMPVYLPPGLTLSPGRPDLVKHLDVLVSSTMCGGGCSGVFVGACGSVSLTSGACEVVRCFDPRLKRAVGGIEYHEDVF